MSILLILGLLLPGCSFNQEKMINSYASHKATMRAYNVMGKHYKPTYVEKGDKMIGISSWYGPNFHGKLTSNGETYNMYTRTAAHKTWPMNTMVKVSNKDNGKSTVVRINDRGPFVDGRIIDCSYTAGKEIGLDTKGIANVVIEVVGFAGRVYSDPKALAEEKKKVKLSNFSLQLGSFTKLSGAQAKKNKYMGMYKRYNPTIKTFLDKNADALYRVWLMGFGSEEEARDFKDKNNLSDTFIVRN
jgi:rare lipoprotein A